MGLHYGLSHLFQRLLSRDFRHFKQSLPVCRQRAGRFYPLPFGCPFHPRLQSPCWTAPRNAGRRLPQFLCREPGNRSLAAQFVKSIGKVGEQRLVKDVDHLLRWRIRLGFDAVKNQSALPVHFVLRERRVRIQLKEQFQSLVPVSAEETSVKTE